MPDLAIKGLPRSGTTALQEYINQYTRLEATASYKHRPLDDQGHPIVHIVTHPAPWLVRWVDWTHSAATREDLNRFPWITQKVYDWASRATDYHEQAAYTFTHHELLTDLPGVLHHIENLLGEPSTREADAEITSRRYGSPTRKGPFDPSYYVNAEYLAAIPDGVLPELEDFLLSEWALQFRDRFGFNNGWWESATLKPSETP